MMFGTCTGTIPTGLILLRMVDSELKTTVSVEAGIRLGDARHARALCADVPRQLHHPEGVQADRA